MLLGQELARGVDRRPGDVGVDVDAAGHDDHPARVDPAGVRRHVGDDLAVLHADVAHLAGDPVRGVVTRARRRSGASGVPSDRRQHVLDARSLRGPRRAQRERHAVHPVDGTRHLDAVGRGGERDPRRVRRRGGARVDDHRRQLAQARQVLRAGRWPRRARRRRRRARAARRRRAPRAGGRGRSSPAPAKPVCHASTSSAPRALPSPRSASVTAWRSRLRSRTSENSASAAELVERAVDERDVARLEQAPREAVERGLSGVRERRARDPRAQFPQRLEAVVAPRRATRGATRRRSSRRGCVTAGSARQTTTSSARSRISPKVAVLAPIAW